MVRLNTERLLDIGKLLEWVKLPPRLLFALAAICGILVFSPTAFLKSLGLESIVDLLRSWIGFGFVMFSVLLVAHFFAWLSHLISPWVKEWFLVRLHRKRLHQLDTQEKQLLAQYFAQDTRTLRLDPKDGTAIVLSRELILAPSAPIGDFINGVAYAVQPWAWEYLKKHPELLGLNRSLTLTEMPHNEASNNEPDT